jgi:hypothetical protein
VVIAFAVLAAVVPATAIAAAIVLGLLGGLRPGRRLLAPAAPIAAALLARALVPAAPPPLDGGYVAGVFAAGTLAALGSHLRLVLGLGGPYLTALMVLGVVVSRRAFRDRRTWAALIVAVLPLASSTPDLPSALRVCAPALIAVWTLAAAGLTEVVHAAGAHRPAAIGATILVALLPVLQLLPPSTRLAPDRVPDGHAALSSNGFRHILTAMPNASVIVREDATTDLLLRAARASLAHAGLSWQSVDRDAAILPAIASSRASVVVAWPSAQQDLQYAGFELHAAGIPGARGTALVHAAGSCQPLSQGWRDVSATLAPGAFALVAPTAAADGPIVIYAAGTTADSPAPIAWPGGTTRGFQVAAYDRSDAADRAREAADEAEDELPPALRRRVAGAHLVRFELWRTPDAPLRLGVRLGEDPAAAVARLRSDAAPQTLRLCAAFPYVIEPIGWGGV